MVASAEPLEGCGKAMYRKIFYWVNVSSREVIPGGYGSFYFCGAGGYFPESYRPMCERCVKRLGLVW